MHKVLVIGCGNIGAQYDLHNNEIQTHAKAWHLNPAAELFVYDIDLALAKLVSEKYNCGIVKSIDQESLRNFDCVSICSPTNTHFRILEDVLAAKVGTVICEKPVSGNERDLAFVKQLYNNSDSKILVNYIRRFLPSFAELKDFITSVQASEELTNISIRYQRGFVNNCSHAFDLVEYLTGAGMDLSNVHTSNLITDHFNDDPTLSLQGLWKNVNFNVLGLSNVCFSHFEIDIYFRYYKIAIKNAGDVIEVYRSEKSGNNLQPLALQAEFTRHGCLKDYMMHVTDHAMKLINGEVKNDNFLGSVNLNQNMLKYKDN